MELMQHSSSNLDTELNSTLNVMPLAMKPMDLTAVEALLYVPLAEVAVSYQIRMVLSAPPGPQNVMNGLFFGTTIFSLRSSNTQKTTHIYSTRNESPIHLNLA